MLGRCKDEHVINVVQNVLLTLKDLAHSPLKLLWCSGDPEQELVETILLIWCKEDSQMSGVFG